VFEVSGTSLFSYMFFVIQMLRLHLVVDVVFLLRQFDYLFVVGGNLSDAAEDCPTYELCSGISCPIL
jgi:hypothetical protein